MGIAIGNDADRLTGNAAALSLAAGQCVAESIDNLIQKSGFAVVPVTAGAIGFKNEFDTAIADGDSVGEAIARAWEHSGVSAEHAKQAVADAFVQEKQEAAAEYGLGPEEAELMGLLQGNGAGLIGMGSFDQGALDHATGAVYAKYESIAPGSGDDALKILNHAATRDDLRIMASLVMADTQQLQSLDSNN